MENYKYKNYANIYYKLYYIKNKEKYHQKYENNKETIKQYYQNNKNKFNKNKTIIQPSHIKYKSNITVTFD